MSNLVAAVKRVGLPGLEQGVHGLEGGLDAGQVGVARDFVELGGGLDIPNAVEVQEGHGHCFGEDNFQFIGRIELRDKACVHGGNGPGIFGGKNHVAAEQAVLEVVAGSASLAFRGHGAMGFGAVGAGGCVFGFGGWRFGRHCDFIVHGENGAGGGGACKLLRGLRRFFFSRSDRKRSHRRAEEGERWRNCVRAAGR